MSASAGETVALLSGIPTSSSTSIDESSSLPWSQLFIVLFVQFLEPLAPQIILPFLPQVLHLSLRKHSRLTHSPTKYSLFETQTLLEATKARLVTMLV